MSEKPNELHPFGQRERAAHSERDYVRRLVSDEFRAQDAKWGEQNHEDGTGPFTTPLLGFRSIYEGIHAEDLKAIFTYRTDERFRGEADLPGAWRDILLEEVFEALAEEEAGALVHELVQVAAVAQQWAAAVIRRERNKK